jgi:hypothetical protein
MNIGIYVNSLSNEDQVGLSIESIELGFNNNTIDDATIFYDSVGFSPFIFPCGAFNSTELWNFSGKLITFSLDCVRSSLKIVNKIDIYYCYGWENRINPLNLIDVCSNNIKIFTKTNKDTYELYRLTGLNSMGSLETSSLLKLIGSKNE